MKLSGEYLILLTLAVSSVILGVFTDVPPARRHLRSDRHPPARVFGWTMRRPSDWVIPTLVLDAGRLRDLLAPR